MKFTYNDVYSLPRIKERKLVINFISCNKCQSYAWIYDDSYICSKCKMPVDYIELAVIASCSSITVILSLTEKVKKIEHRVYFRETDWYRKET